MEAIENYWFFIIASFVLAITPGPDILYVLSRGLNSGRKAALSAAAGFSLGNIFHLTLLILGISALILANSALFSAIKYLGAAYLAFLGVRIWQSASTSINQISKTKPDSLLRIFGQSILANILNPKVIAFFLALFPQFIKAEARDQNYAILYLGLSFIVITWIVFSSVGLFAGYIGEKMRKNPSIGKNISRVAGIILILLGVSLIFT